MQKLPRRVILKSPAEFQEVYRRGRSFASGVLVLYVMKSSGETKAAFAAGKKIGSAPVRSRLKRMMREAYRKHRERIIPGRRLILVARLSAVGVKTFAVESAFLELAARARILRQEAR